MLINEEILTKSILKNGIDILDYVVINNIDLNTYINRINEENLKYPIPAQSENYKQWLLPDKYLNFEIEQYLIDICPKENYLRLKEELVLFKKHNMYNMLRAMKYIVDLMQQHKIIWGVGRGSGVASYVLFLIGVHRIDSVKYNLSIYEFFKGEQNG